jgi:MOSC domain-containing protein YiiM
MRLASINIGRPKELAVGGRTTATGIYKRPVLGAVHLGRLGLDGDAVVDGKVHGGPDQAVYVYGSEDYEWFSFRFGHPLEPGFFGDNLTVDGLASDDFAVGDRLAIGDTVVIEVSAPRMPCNTLALRIGNAQFVKRFREAGRPGFYCRVIVEGEVRTGDPVEHRPCDGDRVTIVELFRAHYEKQTAAAALRRFLAAPLSERLRKEKLEQLAKLTAPAT